MFVNTFRKFGYKGNDEVLRHIHFAHRGGPMLEQFELAAKEVSLKADPAEMLSQNVKSHKKQITKMTIFPGFEKFIRNLKAQGKMVSIMSNREKSHLDIILSKWKIIDLFTEIISCSDEGHEKPDPKCMMDLMAKYDLKKSEYIYFGDSKTDAEFAQNAGVDYLVIDHYLNKANVYENLISLLLS